MPTKVSDLIYNTWSLAVVSLANWLSRFASSSVCWAAESWISNLCNSSVSSSLRPAVKPKRNLHIVILLKSEYTWLQLNLTLLDRIKKWFWAHFLRNLHQWFFDKLGKLEKRVLGVFGGNYIRREFLDFKTKIRGSNLLTVIVIQDGTNWC